MTTGNAGKKIARSIDKCISLARLLAIIVSNTNEKREKDRLEDRKEREREE